MTSLFVNLGMQNSRSVFSFENKNVSTVVHENVPIHDNVDMPASSFVVREPIDESIWAF